MKKIAVTTTTFNGFIDVPIIDFDVTFNPYGRKITSEEFVDLVKDSIGVIAGTENITKEVIEKLPNLKVISRCGIGLDNLDMVAIKEAGIKVFNTPDVLTSAVAEFTVGLIIDILRGISRADRNMRSGKWKKDMGVLLQGKNVGIIGLGRIGKKVTELLLAFGCNVCFYDPYVEWHRLNFMNFTKEDLVKNADIISIHASTNEQLLGEEEFKIMKDGVYIVNTSRGGIINEEALIKYLKNGKIAGVVFDVYEQEPYSGELTKMNNVVLTPHIGSYAKEARMQMEKEAIENLLKGLGV